MALKDLRFFGGKAADIETEAHVLAQRLPALLIEARRVAHTVSHGIHGRRRSGPGETFWQFRRFEKSDSAGVIDWRRSAASDTLYVREREWEAAHTIWLWPDMSSSMAFCSHLAPAPKIERSLVLTLALGELLAQAGEKIGIIGILPPTAQRNAVNRAAEAIVQPVRAHEDLPSLPPPAHLGRFSECLLFSDFLQPIDRIESDLHRLADQGVNGHMVQILDPAEESLPYEGRTEFLSSDGDLRVLAGRAESLRERYQERMHAHQLALKDLARRLEWSFLRHHTGHPPEHALLAIHNRLAGLEMSFRYRPSQEKGPSADIIALAPQTKRDGV